MTATPIPRTLLLTQWGEMDVSRLTEKPPGRQPVRTSLHSLGTLPDLLDAVARKLDEGAQVYGSARWWRRARRSISRRPRSGSPRCASCSEPLVGRFLLKCQLGYIRSDP